MSTTYLITGANRGIGRGLVAAYLNQPRSVVIAAVRNPADPTSQSLKELPRQSSSSLIIVKIRSTSDTDAKDAIKELQTTFEVKSLDIVIANAGLSGLCPRVEDATVQDLQEYYHVDVISVVVLFQAVLPLLVKSKAPKFIAMGSIAGTIGAMEEVPVPNGVYGPVKAALNWVMKKIHIEHEDLIAFPVHPGFTQTETANKAAKSFGMEEAPVPLEDSIAGLKKVVGEATRESHGGKFASFDGSFLPW